MRRLKIFTWHVHGAYLLYLSQIPHDIYIPVGRDGMIGKEGAVAYQDNIHEIPVEEIRGADFDCILFQNKDNYVYNQYSLFSDKQLNLPKIYIEHDPPREHPTNTRHWVERETLLVHVTHYNKLMWAGNNNTEKRVIEHGVFVPDQLPATGSLDKGITVINNLRGRKRRLGCDIFLEARNRMSLDLIGMDSESLEGLGEVSHHDLPSFICNYRYLFHPVRYTSLALAVCEAMAVGLPVVGLATTELPSVIENRRSGFLSNNLNELIPVMEELNRDWELAQKWGEVAKQIARERFSIERFVRDWNDVLNTVVG